jgi:two-component system, OmpR family, response regulator
VGVSASNPKPDGTRPVLCFAGWRLDIVRRELRSVDNSLVFLSGGEFDLLLTFLEHPHRTLSRDQLIDLARGSTHIAFDRSVDVQVSRLRNKLEQDPRNPELIRTIRGVGYMFLPEVTRT